MSLFAPLAVVVEVRCESRDPAAARVFRLSRAVADSGLLLDQRVPFEIDQPVIATFSLPDLKTLTMISVHALVAASDSDDEAALGGSALVFRHVTGEERQAIGRYVAGRLGLPDHL